MKFFLFLLLPVLGICKTPLLTATVKMGHKTSKLELIKKEPGSKSPYLVTLQTTDGISKKTDLSKENYDFILSKLKSADPTQIEKGPCEDIDISIDDYTGLAPRGWRTCGQSEIVKVLMLLF